MVLQRIQRIIALSSLLLIAASAFSAQKTSELARSPSTTTSSALNAVFVDDGSNNDELDGGVFSMSRASACANSETCSLDEAQSYLQDILMIQKDCLDVTLSASNSALCENVDTVVEVVANLRQKIDIERKRVAPVKATINFFNGIVGVYVVFSILHGFAAVPNVPVDAPMFSSFDTFDSRGVVSILPTEWFWAIRDGYFPSLFSEWISNGGLVVDVSAFDTKAVAFTPQEWVWSIQNGSFGNLIQENMRYGGYLVDSSFDNEGMTPMTAQDVLWSIQGGYVGDAAKHFFRNGGV
jgi:hypothetical protein